MNVPRLQTHQHEGQHVHDEDRGLPDRIGADPLARPASARHGLRQGHGVDNHSDDRRESQPISEEPDTEGGDELQDRVAGGIAHAPAQAEIESRQRVSGNDAARGRQQDERPVARQRERADRRHDRGAVDQQGGRVVEQALALQDEADALRKPEALQHRSRGAGIGRRDDGAEGDGGGKRQAGIAPAEEGDCRGREHHRDDRQRGDGNDVAAQLARRGIEGGIEQRRRYEQRQRKVRVDADAGRERQEGNTGAGDGQQRRVGHAEALGDHGQDDGGGEQRDNPFEQDHAASVMQKEATKTWGVQSMAGGARAEQDPNSFVGPAMARPAIYASDAPIATVDALFLFDCCSTGRLRHGRI